MGIKFLNSGEKNNFGNYESSMFDSNHLSPKKKYINQFDLNITEDIEEVEDEENVNETEGGVRRSSHEISANNASYTRMKSQFLKI